MDISPPPRQALNLNWQAFQNLGARALAVLVLAVAAAVLLGWIAAIPTITRFADDFPAMVFNTALFFALLSLGLICDRHVVFGFCSKITGTIVFVLSALTLLQYWLDMSFGIDEWFWSDNSVDPLSLRSSPSTCWTFMLLSGLMMVGSILRRHSHNLVIALIILGALTPTTGAVIYIYDYSDLAKVDAFSTMAIHTSVSFILLYMAVAMGVGRRNGADHYPDDGPGFRQFRRLILPTLFIPLGTGAVLHQLVNQEYLTASFGLAIMASGFCLTIVSVLLWNSRREDEWFDSLNQEIEARVGAQSQLTMLLDTISKGVLFVGRDGKIKLANDGASQLFEFPVEYLQGRHIRELLASSAHESFDKHFDNFINCENRTHYTHQPFRISARNASGDEFPVLASVGYLSEAKDNGFGVLLLNGEMIERQMEQLRHKVRTDHLTLVGNRSSLDARMDELNAYGSRSEKAVALIMVDIDHFKKVNDRFGHAAGDSILSDFAREVEDSLRYSDSLYRYGGEEFVIVTIGASLPHVRMLAERIRMRIESYLFPHKTKTIHITCSLGVAVRLPSEKLEHCLERADNSLFVAKNTGRNRVVVNERHDMN